MPKGTYCHLTYEKHISKIDKGNNNVYLKTSKSLSENIAMLFKPCVYFFIGEPDKKQLKQNDLDKERKYVI